jgi:hypothetical protein
MTESRIPLTDRFRAGGDYSGTVKWVGLFGLHVKNYRWKALVFRKGDERIGFGVVYPEYKGEEIEELTTYLNLGLDVTPSRGVLGWILQGSWDSTIGVCFDDIEDHLEGGYPLTVSEITSFSRHLDWFIRFQREMMEDNQ